MSASRNEDAAKAVSGPGQGEFSSRIAPDEPLTTTGHQPGLKTSPADHAPEFHAQTLPAGTAPASRTFQPNAESEVAPIAQGDDDDAEPGSGSIAASDTLTGATSADVHTGLGHPGEGQSSAELRHDGEIGRKRQGVGLVGRGAGGVANEGVLVDERNPEFADQRALGKSDEAAANAGQRGEVGGLPAEEREPESDVSVAAEASRSG